MDEAQALELLAAGVPSDAVAAVMVKSEDPHTAIPALGIKQVKKCAGYDFNQGVNYDKLMANYRYQGFQGTNLGKAIDEINAMRNWRLSDVPWKEGDDEDLKDPKVRAEIKTTIFMGFTSNMISCGNREVIRYLCQHNMIDVIVTTGGGIEEDFMKCFEPHFMGDFALDGKKMRMKGMNRIGNLIVPNKNYCHFEDFLQPLLDTMLEEQKTLGTVWTPSKMIHRMGKEINNEESVYYWCWKNNIPVYCPAITDGAVGDMIYFHSYKNPGFVLDIAGDIRGINDSALMAKHTGMMILGGGLIKHHICNANLMRNGADHTVFINTGQEFDGSDSGARPDEAVSWGKIKLGAKAVKVYADASLVFPLIVAETFAKGYDSTTKTYTTTTVTTENKEEDKVVVDEVKSSSVKPSVE
jgi:deoxyhypusine synthase